MFIAVDLHLFYKYSNRIEICQGGVKFGRVVLSMTIYYSPMHFMWGVFIYLFGGLRCFQHCTGHITTGSWKGRGNQYIQLVKVLYCKLPTNGKQLPAFPLEAVPGT